MKAQYLKVPIDIYKRGVLVFIGDMQDCIDLLAEDGFSAECRESLLAGYKSLPTHAALCTPIEEDVLVYMETMQPIGVFDHELSHATFALLKKVDINPLLAEEAYAYLHEYLTEKVYQWLDAKQ